MFAGLLVAAWALAWPATAADKVVEPDWELRPRGEDMAEHYPKIAATLMIEGRATISCSVNADGRLTGCTVIYETPVDLGFGAGALALADSFKMRPMTVNGEPVAGGTVRIPIAFRLPQIDPQPSPPDPGSKAAMDAALRFVDVTNMVDRALKDLERNLRFQDPGVPAPVRSAGLQALRAAWSSHREAMRQAYAKAVASVYTEDEINVIADFSKPEGRPPGDSRLQAAPALIVSGYLTTMREAAHAAYCAKQDCPGPSDLAKVWQRPQDEPPHLDSPQWREEPSAYEVRRAAPKLPAAVGLSASVRLSCGVEASGELTDCRIADEAPKGLGYGEAALSLADQYRLHPLQLANPGDGRRVVVRVSFTPVDLPKAYEPPSGATEEALKHAREVAGEFWDGRPLSAVAALLGSAESKPESADEELYEALADAYRAGGKAAERAAIEMFAHTIAAGQTEEELARLAAFFTSPTGRAFRERAPAVSEALGKAMSHVSVSVAKDARGEFCRTFDCAPSKTQPADTRSAPSARQP